MAKLSGIPRGGPREHDSAHLLSVRDAAAALGVHEHTLRAWVRKGIIRALVLPGSNYHRFSGEEVKRLRNLMEKGGAERRQVRIQEPRSDPRARAEAERLCQEVMAILAQHPPEEPLEEAMARLRGRPWSS